ncbi:hypothetical protein KGM_205928 [Danaus plexippus plexippus]|uniref:Uncharacterized protein n=1 Tax=Danaus plexippus plexippus TaxID=278856 RepID=A0A212FNY2_DANPL|nr:hypothetical protein KGM_205928 [Danaus plexippus plexippus]
MSAVMSTLSMISGGRRAHRKLTNSRKSGQFSDAGEDRTRSQHDLNKQRSASLMASIEVSLAGSRRRSAAGRDTARDNTRELDALRAAINDKDILIQNDTYNSDQLHYVIIWMASIEVSLAGSRRRSAAGRDTARDNTRELDALRAAINDKDILIQNLKKQLSASLSAARLGVQASSPVPYSGREDAPVLSPEERRALEERAAAVRSDLDARRANIQELKRRLEKTHVTENIDSRIEQAELQYQLGREELELLTLGEQARALALLMDQADAAARARRSTLFSIVTTRPAASIVRGGVSLLSLIHNIHVYNKKYLRDSVCLHAARVCANALLIGKLFCNHKTQPYTATAGSVEQGGKVLCYRCFSQLYTLTSSFIISRK